MQLKAKGLVILLLLVVGLCLFRQYDLAAITMAMAFTNSIFAGRKHEVQSTERG